MDKQLHNKTTFRFRCGRIQHIDDQVIQQIPYLSALLSIANHVSNIKDENGHILLDSNINFEHFNIISDALPFSEIYKIFIRIRMHNDFNLIIMLVDFLGLIGSVVPSLNEIDLFFFSAWMFKPSKNKYFQQLFPTKMQDVAALFIMGLIRGDYDSTDDRVIDRIYWYVMFILSGHVFFHPILRSHLQRASEQYFQLYKPSLLSRLNELSTITKRKKDSDEASFQFSSIEDGEFNKTVQNRVSKTYIQDPNKSYFKSILVYHSNSLYDKDYEFYSFPTLMKDFSDDTLVHAVADMINQRLDLRIREKFVQEIHKCVAMHRSSGFQTWIRRTLLHDVIEDDAMRISMRSLIVEGMPTFIDKMKEKHQLHQQAVQKYSDEYLFDTEEFRRLYRRSPMYRRLMNLKEVTEKCRVHLERLTQDQSMLEEIEQHVCEILYSSNTKRICEWLKTQDTIRRFYEDETRHRRSKSEERQTRLNVKRDQDKKHRFHWSNRSSRQLKLF